MTVLYRRVVRDRYLVVSIVVVVMVAMADG